MAERDSKGKFVNYPGPGRSAADDSGIDEFEKEANKQRRTWGRYVVKAMGKDNEACPMVYALLDNASLLFREVLRLQARRNLTSNELDKLRSLSNSMRLTIHEAFDMVSKERKLDALEDRNDALKNRGRRVY